MEKEIRKYLHERKMGLIKRRTIWEWIKLIFNN